MADSKVIAVMGATGAQGGGLVRAILADPEGGFSARAVTRNAGSDAAQELARLGAEVVEANMDEPATIERAFDGAYGVFCVTFFWEHMNPELEIVHAQTMADAAKAAGVSHVVWSTLDDSREHVPLDDDRMPTLGDGKYKVPHYDGKAEADSVFADAGVPVTYYLSSFNWENLIRFGMGPARGEDGVLALTYPLGDAKLPGMAEQDVGKIAYGIFKRGDEFIGKRVAVAAEKLSGSEMAAALSEALGEEVRYNDVDPDVYRGFGFPGADDVGNMFHWQRDFADEYGGIRDIELSRSLDPELQSFRDWLAEKKDQIPLG
jgi:uncharacterized protein YbjT (DUF2867 family)